MSDRSERYALTPKGMAVLRGGPSAVDAEALKILPLLQQGPSDVESLVRRSKWRRDQMSEALRLLVAGGLVGPASAVPGASPSVPRAALAADTGVLRGKFGLNRGISPAQARFILSNFCLDHFGTGGQALADVIEWCTDVSTLQQAVNNVRSEVEKHLPDKLPVLIACVKEINETAL